MSVTNALLLNSGDLKVSWLGYPATTGAPFVDFWLGDGIVADPVRAAVTFSERLLLLPTGTSYIANDHASLLAHALPPSDPRAADRIAAVGLGCVGAAGGGGGGGVDAGPCGCRHDDGSDLVGGKRVREGDSAEGPEADQSGTAVKNAAVAAAAAAARVERRARRDASGFQAMLRAQAALQAAEGLSGEAKAGAEGDEGADLDAGADFNDDAYIDNNGGVFDDVGGEASGVLRSDGALADGAVLLASFSNWMKMDAETLGVWAAVMRRAPAAALWVQEYEMHEAALPNLAEELTAHGVYAGGPLPTAMPSLPPLAPAATATLPGATAPAAEVRRSQGRRRRSRRNATEAGGAGGGARGGASAAAAAAATAPALGRARRHGRLLATANQPWIHHVESKAAADLVLDTLYKTGHSTSVDALWAGVPIVTLAGERPSQRVRGCAGLEASEVACAGALVCRVARGVFSHRPYCFTR